MAAETLPAATLTRSELMALTTTDMSEEIPAAELTAALATPPFIPAAPLLNLRDMGQLPGCSIPPGRIFRCGQLSSTSAETSAWLADNVAVVYDLRGKRETAARPDPEAEGVDNICIATEGEHRPLLLEPFAKGDGSEAWGEQYLYIAQSYRPTFRKVLLHVHDTPEVPFLFHCTAGRDRTGILAALLHHLAETHQDDVLYDYMLSRVGLEPGRVMLEASIKIAWRGDMEGPGFRNLAAIRPSYFHAFMTRLQEEYGGWDRFVREYLGFSDAEVQKIKANLRA